MRRLLFALALVAGATTAQAQFELRSGTLNSLRQSPVTTTGTITPQFAGKGEASATAGPISTAADHYLRYPSAPQYSGTTVTGAIVLTRASFGRVFATGLPRYSLGETILPPTTLAGTGSTAAPAGYWRTKPIAYGETIAQPGGTNDTPLPNPNAPDAAPALPYYYSPHADRVFAHQAGRVSITWVTAQPVGPAGTTGVADNPKLFRFKSELFSVSSATTLPVRPMFWTEGTFNSPRVTIPTGRIVAVNPVYSEFFPATVDEAFKPLGSDPNPNPNASPPEELKTLWFENLQGLAQLKAYNIEGRILIEYLGGLKTGFTDVHEFLGADIIEVQQVATATTATIQLGEEILPFDPSGQIPANAFELQPSPVLNLGQQESPYYGTSARPNGSLVHHAEKENHDPDKVSFYWLEPNDAGIFFASEPGLEVYWPRYLNRYLQVWPDSLAAYAGVTVSDTGSTPDTGVSFATSGLPVVVHQDDIDQAEVTIDAATQRLVVGFAGDLTNRTLLRFTRNGQVWYVRLYVESENVLGSPATETTPAVPALADLNADGIRDLVVTGATVGARIERPDDTYQLAGYISSGTGYHVGAYRNPYRVGMESAATGAIIPVNARPGDSSLTVWWFRKIESPVAGIGPFFVPAKSGVYSVSWPAGGHQIVLASNQGSGDLSPAQAAGEIYFQNDLAQPGYNPNEEHALMLGGRVWALRDDLNQTAADNYSSNPAVLLTYADPVDNRPSVRLFHVVRELDLAGTDNDVLFDYPVTAGSVVPAPMPLPLLPPPLLPDGSVANTEVPGNPDPAPNPTAPDSYDTFTLTDRNGQVLVYRGPHGLTQPSMGMQFYYTMRDGFYFPSLAAAAQPAPGSLLPYLRALNASVPQGDPVTGTPLTVTYRPVWPAIVPELRVAESLTLPKFGLPQVRGQSSAQIVYQQSIATNGTTQPSVTLHDPTRAKKVLLSSVGLSALPASLATTSSQGRTYFQRVAPHLQHRFYAVPAAAGDTELVLEGEFVNEPAGEDYLNLNALSAADRLALQSLADTSDPDQSAWASAVDALATQVETFVENPSKRGTYIVGSSETVGVSALARITDDDTAVDSYALTATGDGSGYVTLIFGDGEAFTPTGEPVSLKIIKVAPRLYTGDLKVQFSSNPLDEQVSLRHSGDFAAEPGDYEFEWRYAQPVDGLPPVSYAFGNPVARLGPSTPWTIARNPVGPLPTENEYSLGVTATLPRSLQIYDQDYVGSGLPGIVLRATTPVDFSTGVPAEIIFSAQLTDPLDGFVLHVNGAPALAYQAPPEYEASDPTSGLSATALPLQFKLSPNPFTPGFNTIEIALFSGADPGAYSTVDFRLETRTEQDRVDPAVFPASPWLQPGGTLQNQITIGGSPAAPLGHPLLLMQDNYFTMRYRPKAGNVAGTAWSRWMEPRLVPGWIKRVLAAINPFNQRMTDLYNNQVNTDVSVITQAGPRWEGDIALTLDNVNEAGLIEIYETVLNRGRQFSIDNGYNNPGANDALLLAAGYLNDLYEILGNEAQADAANPTIALDDQLTVTEVSTSRFAFEGQVATVLDEELALLQGRDDFLATSVTTSPAYNRLYWNYTNGINSGEVLYAVNYNIKEKSGSPTADGLINAADAQRLYPQGHGDAYGHYLTALKGYYKLLTHENFTWTPRSEAVLVLGQNVSVDYFDERKFAGSAASLARTAEQILSLTFRKSYREDASAGWSHFRDNTLNVRSGLRRQWGLDEWASRATQGAYFNWIAGNAILPDVDTNPQHTGIQKVDRSTVPELAELVNAAGSFQSTIDNANARLNPLGLSPGAIPFDIDPTFLAVGSTAQVGDRPVQGLGHFGQIYQRALRALNNAAGSFDQAARMSGMLRHQENQIDDYVTSIVDQERAFNYQLIELFGTPYSAEIGPGKIYAQGYEGPDLVHYFLVDEATDSNLVNLVAPMEEVIRVPLEILGGFGPGGEDDFRFENYDFNSIFSFVGSSTSGGYTSEDGDTFPLIGAPEINFVETTVKVQPNTLAQIASVFLGTAPGQRAVTGEIQSAVAQAREAQIRLIDVLGTVQYKEADYQAALARFSEMMAYHFSALDLTESAHNELLEFLEKQKEYEGIATYTNAAADTVEAAAHAVAEFFPKVLGLSNDTTSPVRGGLAVAAVAVANVMRLGAIAVEQEANLIDVDMLGTSQALELALAELEFDYEERQFVYEMLNLFMEYNALTTEVAVRASEYQRALEHQRNVLNRANRVLAEREVFRRRAAAIVQGFRTNDVAFRTFRNEALEQYRSLFDLAARYSYLAAKSYDYETGLLGTPQGNALVARIVASRSLGALNDGVPQATTSLQGDPGLASVMARLNADFSVAEGRLGINNPDINATVFSLRGEFFRILDDPNQSEDDDSWRQTLEQHIVSDLMSDPDAAAFCRNLRKPDGSRVPGLIIPFSTTIQHGLNFFGLPMAAGDHAFSPSNFATKISSVAVALPGYIGLDEYASGNPASATPALNDPLALSATPYLYLIPTGTDSLRAPPLGDQNVVRSWAVEDQALPLPFNLGGTDFNGAQFLASSGTLGEKPWVTRKHQAFRPVSLTQFDGQFPGEVPVEFTSRRLIGRSAWNSGWKLIIPAYTLLNDEQDGLNRFTATVRDIRLYLRTYSHAGN